ncbi:FAD/NAD(P)-binding protein [Kitasatospora sp. NPDC056138]|uniref:FAD/NAD(P)-binding protein n=1 Tax=Kitasatospora sp. NPDC056138 TaxID=3345724 RepID=UPI0035E07163
MSTVTPPLPYRVAAARPETADTVSLELLPVAAALPRFQPGQFAMVYAFGVGEVPISVSAIRDSDSALVHTVRAVGAVSGALCRLRPGDVVGLRGPYGTGWDLDSAAGADVLVIAGGIGLAPLRPVVHHVLERPGEHGRLGVLVGARAAEDLLYRDELRHWRASARVEVTVDRPTPGWQGAVGVVTGLLDRVELREENTCALLCGPEVMIRHTAQALTARGLPAHRIQVSLERNMKCGTGHCGHCQLGPLLLCLDGPVVDWAGSQSLLAVREL